MITTINEWKIYENNSEDYFSFRFKISMPKTSGRIVYPNIQEWTIHFQLENQEQTEKGIAYKYRFTTNLSNKYFKNKENFFYNNFFDKLNNLGFKHINIKSFDDSKYDGIIMLYK